MKLKKIDVKKTKEKVINKVKDTKNKLKQDKKKTHTYILIGLMGLLITTFTLFIIFMLFIIISSPDFSSDKLYEKESSIIYDKAGNEFARLGVENREIVSYEDLPQVLVDAVVATEDSRFFQHNGFDIARFIKASFGQLRGNSGAGGASTLSMQVVKNTFTSTKVSITRKFTDIYMSIFKIEKNYTKEEIIEFYVNAPFLGNSSYGVEQASQTYFGKSVKDLTLSEAALIAGLFQAPDAYNPFKNPEIATKRRATVLNLMHIHGYITKEEKDIANSIPVKSLLTVNTKTENIYQGFIDTVVEEIKKDTGNNPYNVPMEIYSTMDKDVQLAVNKIYDGSSVHTFVNDVVQYAVAVTNTEDGSIAAIGAGRNRQGERKYNYATMIKRQPGSSIKPFMDYGPLIEYNNASPATIFFDEPYAYSNGTSIKNFDGGFQGMMTMKTALRESRNIPALQAFQQVDPEKITEFANNCGIDFGDELYESYSIGSFSTMNPLLLSAAYGTIGRGGDYIEPYSYKKLIYRQNSEEIEKKPTKLDEAMSKSTAFILNNMLNYNIKNGLIGNANTGNTQVGGKTGTSNIDKNAKKKYNISSNSVMDSWLAVYSPEYSIAQWYGYNEISSDYYLRFSEASSTRGKLGRYLVKAILNTGNGKSFPKSNEVVKVNVEYGTIPLALVSKYTPSNLIVSDYFKAGTEPTEESYRFKQLENVKKSSINTSVTGNIIKISWDKIDTPDAINNTFLTNYFNEGYKQWAEKYLNQRLTYNTNYIGTNGYQIYLKDSSGNLTNLGFTKDNDYSFTSTGDNSYTFVIKSAYSIFKDNMSSGVEVKVNLESNSNSDSEISITLKESSKVTIPKSTGYYTENSNSITVTKGSSNITSQLTINKQYMKSDNTVLPNGIPKDTIGEYKVVYSFTYNGNTYSAERQVIVQ